MLKTWFRRFQARREPIAVPPVDLDRVREAVEQEQRSSEALQNSMRPYHEAKNPLFALLSRAVNEQAWHDDED